MFNAFYGSLFFSTGIVSKYQDIMAGTVHVYSADNVSADSLHGIGTFFQKQPVVINPQLIRAAGSDWIFYLLFGLLLLIAFIRFLYPAAITVLLSWFSGTGFRKSADNYSKPGLLVPSFLMLNFVISITLLIIVIRVKAGASLDVISSSPQFWLFAAGGIVGFFLYNQISAFLIGFVFDTGNQTSMQIKNNIMWAYVSGLFLTPLLLIYFYTQSDLLLDVMVAGLIILLLFKWFQTVKVGLFTRNYNVLHLFLYLCAVEIVPLFLLVKVYTM